MSEVEQQPPAPSGPFVVHVDTITDIHDVAGPFGSQEEVNEFVATLTTNQPGKLNTTQALLQDPQAVLDTYPKLEAPPEVQPVAAQSVGIPDDVTLTAMSRADLDALAASAGLDPANYSNKGDVILALQEQRDA